MARSDDPKIDLMRCADLINECGVLVSRGINCEDILGGISERIRDNVLKMSDYGPRPTAGA